MNKQIIENCLVNRFDMTNIKTGFVDRYSHCVVSVNGKWLELSELSTRGLVGWRESVCAPVCSVGFTQGNDDEHVNRFYIQESKYLPWVVVQNGKYLFNDTKYVDVKATLFSPAFNTLTWKIDLTCGPYSDADIKPVLSGNLVASENAHTLRKCTGGVVCIFEPAIKQSKYTHYPQIDDRQPGWSVRCDQFERVNINHQSNTYSIDCNTVHLRAGEVKTLYVQVDYLHLPDKEASAWQPGPMLGCDSSNEIISERRDFWLSTLEHAAYGDGDVMRKLRSAAGLMRCGYQWREEVCGQELVASYCSITSWSSTAFFWDSLISSIGISLFDKKLARDTVKALYLRQRDDGCVPTHSYEHALGSTFYPQAPLTGWAMVHMLNNGMEIESVNEIVPAVDKLQDWFEQTQDQDGDGLYEWRFTGCPADNSPQFDHYSAPLGKLELWNIYLPPVASVGLNSYLIMEMKSLAHIARLQGDSVRSSMLLAKADVLGDKLKDICLHKSGVFFDYDHHLRAYNTALTLFSFLPVWAGVRMDEDIKRNLIENYLLNKEHFFGDYPFPYLAYSEDAYTPQGYWRGRVWPHTCLWMLELLWANGYEKEADEAARRLLLMMGQKEEILENYFSNPQTPGGGEPDYNWSFSSYLYIENHLYRRPVITVFG